MALTQLKGSSQIRDGSIPIIKVEANFLAASDWDITDGNNNATITGLRPGTNPNDAVNFQQFETALSGLDFQPDVLNKQTDATLDPGGSPTTGDRYILSNVGSLHANFGAITGVGDGDIVEYDGSGFEVAYDVSALGAGALVWNTGVGYFERWDGSTWGEFGGLAGVVAGAGMSKTGNTLNIGAADNSITVNADDIQVTIGNNNGTSLVVSASGLELASNITGDRIFSAANFGVSMTATASFSGATLTNIGSTTGATNLLGASVRFEDTEVTNATVTTAIPFSITPTTDYGNGNGTALGDVIDQFRAEFTDDAIINALLELKANIDNNVSKLTPYHNEIPTVTDGSPVIGALANLGTHATDKVTNVRIHLNGNRQNPGAGNDYTLNVGTGVVTFTFNLDAADLVLADYDSQDA